MPKNANRVTAEEADRNAAAIAILVEAGRNSLKMCPPEDVAYGSTSRAFAAEIARLGTRYRCLPVKLGPDALVKMRRLAADYDVDQIGRLAQLVREHSSRFSSSHLFVLLRIGDRKARDRLAKRAVKHSWTVGHLECSVLATSGHRRPAAGRPPSVPEDPELVLVILEGLARKWLRFTARASFAGSPTSSASDIRDLVRSIGVANAAVERVRAAAEARIGR